MTLIMPCYYYSFKILSSGGVDWTSSDVLDWYRIPQDRFCVDRETGNAETGNNGGSVVLVGCLEDFIPKINDVSLGVKHLSQKNSFFFCLISI